MVIKEWFPRQSSHCSAFAMTGSERRFDKPKNFLGGTVLQPKDLSASSRLICENDHSSHFHMLEYAGDGRYQEAFDVHTRKYPGQMKNIPSYIPNLVLCIVLNSSFGFANTTDCTTLQHHHVPTGKAWQTANRTCHYALERV